MKTSDTHCVVSIIITSYNLGAFLEETIDSVLKQTYRQIEVIIVDDGSKDNYTIELLNQLSTNENLKIIRIPNSGVSVARNAGARAAQGEFLVFLDGDDLLSPDFVEKCIGVYTKDPEAGMVYGITKLFGAANRIRPLDTPKYKNLLIYNNIFGVTCMIKKERFFEVKGFNHKMRHGIEDWEFFIRYCYEGMKVYRINKIIFYYRIRPVSRTKEVNSSIKMTLQMRLEILSNNIDIYSKYRKSLKKHCRVIEERNSVHTNLKKIMNLIKISFALLFRKGKAERYIL